MLSTLLRRAEKACASPLRAAISGAALGSSSTSNPALESLERRLSHLFGFYGDSDYIGEPLSIAEHSVQAMVVAGQSGEDKEVQLAALLHDVGHLLGLEAGFPPAMDGCGTVDHEGVGADFIRRSGLTETCAYLTAQHVNAKRYLVWKSPDRPLSAASQITLGHQGGPMTDAEASAAESDGRWPAVLRMRNYDEAAKDPAVPLPNLAQVLRPLLEANLSPSRPAPPYVLSQEQARRLSETGAVLLRGALAPAVAASLFPGPSEAGAPPAGDAGGLFGALVSNLGSQAAPACSEATAVALLVGSTPQIPSSEAAAGGALSRESWPGFEGVAVGDAVLFKPQGAIAPVETLDGSQGQRLTYLIRKAPKR